MTEENLAEKQQSWRERSFNTPTVDATLSLATPSFLFENRSFFARDGAVMVQ